MGSNDFGLPRRRAIAIDISGFDPHQEARSKKSAMKVKAAKKKHAETVQKRQREKEIQRQQDVQEVELAELNKALNKTT